MYSLSSFFYISLLIFMHSAISLTNGYIGVQQYQLIKNNGYPLETYHIQTADGFILELQRIPYGIEKGGGNHFPILLLHGFLDSSFTWIANGPERGLAYLLADQGYDVWMVNFRGNTFSRNHANYTANDPKFWDFSFHEMDIYDLPATIDFVLNETNHQQLLCICDSAGNAVIYMMLSELPQYNNKIIGQVGLAFFHHPRMTPQSNSSVYNNYSDTPTSFCERDLLMKILIQIASTLVLSPDGYNLYDFLLYLVYGLRPDHINGEIMPSIYSNFPAGTSLKVSQHLGQLQNSFSFFDHGPEENLKRYGTTFAPEYNISNIRVPVRIYHALHDPASTPKEVQMFYNELPFKAGVVQISDPNYSHMDFVYNHNNNELLNNDVLDFVNALVKNATSNTHPFQRGRFTPRKISL